MQDVVIGKVDFCCSPTVFTIGGINADTEDFGHSGDDRSEVASEDIPEYGCANMTFTVKDSTPEVLAKYNITQSEYESIGEDLSYKLHVGRCERCA